MRDEECYPQQESKPVLAELHVTQAFLVVPVPLTTSLTMNASEWVMAASRSSIPNCAQIFDSILVGTSKCLSAVFKFMTYLTLKSVGLRLMRGMISSRMSLVVWREFFIPGQFCRINKHLHAGAGLASDEKPAVVRMRIIVSLRRQIPGHAAMIRCPLSLPVAANLLFRFCPKADQRPKCIGKLSLASSHLAIRRPARDATLRLA